jgi:predicted RNase H-like nuclease (RuvC/YqgF family)
MITGRRCGSRRGLPWERRRYDTTRGMDNGRVLVDNRIRSCMTLEKLEMQTKKVKQELARFKRELERLRSDLNEFQGERDMATLNPEDIEIVKEAIFVLVAYESKNTC